MDNNNWAYNDKCIVRNYEKLITEYNILLDKSNRLKCENKCLKNVNEHNSTKIRQMNASQLHQIQSYIVKEDYYLKQIDSLKKPLSSDNVYEVTTPVVQEAPLEKPTDTVDVNMTELEQLHKQIFNNSEVNQWAENCNKLKTEILTCIKEEIFDFVMHLIGQLNKKAEIINNIVGSTENIRCKLVDVTNKPIENDNRIKEITSETCEFKKEDEKPHVEIMEWVKNCNKELSCTRKEVQELKSQFNEKTILVDDLEKRIAKSIIKYGEINTELDTVIDNNNLLTLKVKDYDITIQNNDILIKHLKNDLSSAEEILKIQDAEIFERKKNKALHDAQLKKYKDTILDLEFEIKNHKELHNKLQIKYDKLQNKNEDLNVEFSKQNKIIANHDNVTNDLNVKIISLEKTSRDKDSKIAEIMHKVTERDNELCECVKQKNCLQSALTMLTKSHSKLTTEFNELNEKHQKLTTQFNEQTETINSNKHNEKLWQEALNSVNKISKEKDADLERSNQRITQLTQELIDLKIKKNVHSSTQSDSELLQLYNIVNSSIESKANRVSNLTPDKENKKDNIKNNPVGKDAESNILQAKENPIIDTAEKEKEKSEKNPENLLKEERKQSSKPSKIPLRPKSKTNKDIIATTSMVYNQIKINLLHCPMSSYPRKPIKNMNVLVRRKCVQKTVYEN